MARPIFMLVGSKVAQFYQLSNESFAEERLKKYSRVAEIHTLQEKGLFLVFEIPPKSIVTLMFIKFTQKFLLLL